MNIDLKLDIGKLSPAPWHQENVKLREAIGGLIGYASSVDVDNVPWVRGLALRINRAMEAMGVEEGYVVVGGKIVKAGGE